MIGGLKTLMGGVYLKNLQIAIDGPAGAGKSTVAKKLAEKLNITYVDTGAMYRALTYKALRDGIDIYNTGKIIELAKDTNIIMSQGNLYIDNQLVHEEDIKSKDVTNYVSHVAKIASVRKIMVGLQKKIASHGSVIMDGRDIATHVLPNANIKIYLTASIEERALRRYNELLKKDKNINLVDIKDGIKERDKMDIEREHSPLTKAEDAIILDTTGLDIDEVVSKIISLIELQNLQ